MEATLSDDSELELFEGGEVDGVTLELEAGGRVDYDGVLGQEVLVFLRVEGEVGDVWLFIILLASAAGGCAALW